MTHTVLILGPSGRFGRHAATAFANAGWRVRSFDRKSDRLPDAAMGADVIVNAWNPTYDRWARDVPGQTDRVIEAARASGATVMIPGNVYVFGADAPARFAEDTPHRAANPLGRIRVDMEAAYRAAGIPTIILRAGDFLDTQASGNWFDMVMAKSLTKGYLTCPGEPDVPRAWAYLPDVALAAVALAERRDTLEVFEDVPFPGYTLSAREMAAAISTVVGREVRAKPMNWLPIHIARPFWPVAKGILEMRYIWSKPHHLDGTKFARLLPEFAPTPVEAALAAALAAVDIHPDQPVTTGRPGLAQ
ncbi:MAG: epimerase [Pseudomonadota bacterium]